MTAARISAFLGGPATPDEVLTGVGRLVARGLLHDGDGAGRDTPSGTAATGRPVTEHDELQVPPGVRDVLGRFPAGLGPPSGIAIDEVRTALAAAADEGLSLLRRLVPGPPVGAMGADSRNAAAVSELVRSGLLIQLDPLTVALPREVGLALRGERPLGAATPAAPELVTTAHAAETVDGTAAGQALGAHARCVRLLEIFGRGEIGQLKSGGVGILVVRRLARDLDLDVPLLAMYLELLHATGLLAPVLTRSGTGGTWLPTQEADSFLDGGEAAGWALIADAWLQLRRDPRRVGSKDDQGRVRNALSTELNWRGGPALRHRIVGDLAGLPAGTSATTDSVAARLTFTSPRRDPGPLAAHADAIIAEATDLGIVAFNALCTAGRALFDDDVAGAAAALDAAAPPTVRSILVQADMTVIAAGRLSRELRDALRLAAEVESSGSATVYRVTEASLGRAFDAGATAAQLHELFEKHSATPVPQSLTYLIDDVGRRYGVLRAGEASCYLRSEDPSVIAQAVALARGAGLEMRALAPTVAVCGAEMSVLVEVIRGAGLTLAAEDASGTVLDLRPRPRRTRITVPARYGYSPPAPPSADQVASVIHRMRAGDAASGAVQDARDIMEMLRAAAGSRSPVWIRYADAQGSTSRRIVEPIVVSGGTMVAYDRLRRAPQTFPVHRITSVTAEEQSAEPPGR